MAEPTEPDSSEKEETPKAEPKSETDWKSEADKWRELSRKNEAQAKANAEAARRLAEMEEAQKTAEQRLADQAKALEERARKAEIDLCRYRVAIRKGLTETQARRLVGESEEDLEADAEELLEAFNTRPPEVPPTGGRPKEKLRPGAVPDAEPEETDPAKLAAMVPRSRI